MSLLGLFHCRSLLSIGLLLAETDQSVQAAFPLSPVRIILLLAWFYLCLYLAQRTEDSPLVPDRFRPLCLVASLFVGPFIFLALILADTTSADEETGSVANIIHRFRDAVLRIWGKKASPVDDESTLRLFDATGAELSEIYGHGERGSADRHVLDLTVEVIDNALQQRASDILLDPKDQLSYTVRLRIDGTLRIVRELPSEMGRAVINSVKAVSSMDISERRRPQDGAFTAKKAGIVYSFRVASAGALNGEKLSIRVLNTDAGQFTMTDAGIPDRQRAVIANALAKPSGMIVVCGPTGSGKTTTLYAMLNQIDRSSRNVITVEDPIEAHLPDVSQIEINAKADITFAKTLRSILRQDPDVICVGEIRDEETAEIGLRASQTGHLVLATLHCDSNAMALIRLLDLGVSPMLLSSGLNLLVSQRLVRKLCEHCKRVANISPIKAQAFRQNGIDPKKLFVPVGCEHCGTTGYHGRMAICDILTITDPLRAEIATDAAAAAKLRSEAEKKGRSSLTAEALRLVNEGITSLDELKRVVG